MKMNNTGIMAKEDLQYFLEKHRKIQGSEERRKVGRQIFCLLKMLMESK